MTEGLEFLIKGLGIQHKRIRKNNVIINELTFKEPVFQIMPFMRLLY